MLARAVGEDKFAAWQRIERVAQLRRRRYAEDTAYRETMLADKRKQYAEDDAFRERQLADKKQRYAEDPQYREDMKARARLRYQCQKAEQALSGVPPAPKKRSMSVSNGISGAITA